MQLMINKKDNNKKKKDKKSFKEKEFNIYKDKIEDGR
jgi:hypothetical protein